MRSFPSGCERRSPRRHDLRSNIRLETDLRTSSLWLAGLVRSAKTTASQLEHGMLNP